MRTPITDAAEQTITIDCDDSCVSIYVYESDKIYEGGLVPAHISRRLELDRAALMEALAEIHQESEMGSFAETRAWDALAAAHANFPTN